ncbi:lysine-specific demethylase 2A-like [Paramacrobiotus metropolitanus]|uniref:lysine-specific demethylase 2A-like n=1 Tax=Paramacrobiotus metropolitanus TaxID=2943436 RepID=UPI0024456F25|nr:lysine-specific demethylase 2A-like [Paramacrobiotus metropolitanus]
MIKDISPQEFTMDKLLREGFSWPLVFTNGAPVGMRIPEGLTPDVVAKAAGLKSRVEVINCASQEGIQMPLGQFVEYFTGGEKRSLPRGRISAKIYNLIDLEVSHTRLTDLIDAPLLVRQLDWATNLWPRDLLPPIADLPSEQDHTFSYPKTQKYVLMSKAGSFTDFHIDFGGSSVWYHLLSGKKIFFVIPPSEKNRNVYAQWVRSGQHLVFLADEVDECERIEISPGDTLMLPSGWIHAVYTLDDSVVVGGNFLNSLHGEMQIDISILEQTLKVKKSTRYPFFSDLLWFAVRRYAAVLKGRSPNMSQYEIQSISAVVNYLKAYAELSPSVSPVAAKRIYSPLTLLKEVESHVKRLQECATNSGLIFAMNLPLYDRHVESPEIGHPTTAPQLLASPARMANADHVIPMAFVM